MKIKKKKDEAKETGPEKQYFLNNYEQYQLQYQLEGCS